MAKKKHRKKHNFKHQAPAANAATAAGPTTSSASAEVKSAPAKPAAGVNSSSADFSFVRRDLTKVGILAFVFIAGQFVLWYLFNHSGLGPSVYNLIKL